jgi:hypothetical protein
MPPRATRRHLGGMRLILLVCLLTAPLGAQVDVTFLANEGVMLSAGNKKVLIDGLLRHYADEYALPADSTRAKLEGGRRSMRSISSSSHIGTAITFTPQPSRRTWLPIRVRRWSPRGR